MSTSTVNQCPNCGANNRNSASRCEFCNTVLESPKRPELVEKSLTVLLSSAEKQLEKGNRTTDLLVGVGFAVPMLLLVWSIMWGPGPWIGLLLAFGAFIVFAVSLSSVESRVQGQMFEVDIRPKLLGFLEEHHISKKELLAVAHDQLKEESALREQLNRL